MWENSPNRPSAWYCLMTSTGAANRLLKPTIQNPSAAWAASTIRSALSKEWASGFSSNTSQPASRAATAYCSWNRFGVVIRTASATEYNASSSSYVGTLYFSPNLRRASPLMSTPPASSASYAASRSAWWFPMPPSPTIPIRTVESVVIDFYLLQALLKVTLAWWLSRSVVSGGARSHPCWGVADQSELASSVSAVEATADPVSPWTIAPPEAVSKRWTLLRSKTTLISSSSPSVVSGSVLMSS